MRKLVISAAALGLISVGFAGGWMSSSTLANQRGAESKSTNTPNTNTITPERFVDKSSGEGMAPSEMYSELDKRSGTDFDSQYMAYVILMQNNLTGMNRLAKEKANNAELKGKADEMWQYDSNTTTELYALQKRLGYAHH